jgi:crossover junction endodeoxyribonuclease RuvC
MARSAIRIIGLDPGLRRTGWGVIACAGNRLTFLACGTIIPDETLALGPRLAALHAGLAAVIAAHAPDEAAVEETFVNGNAASTLKLGQARAMSLLVPALHGLPVAEYGANQVKKTVVGVGHADKRQVGAMVRVLLPRAEAAGADAADALAVAITHAHHRTRAALLAEVLG